MTEKNDSILVFEYFTASGEKDKSIISEAEAMLFSLLDDLTDFEVNLVINESYKNVIEDSKNLNTIFIGENIISWLENNSFKYKKAIFIAGENDNNLVNITKILEDNGVKIYTSSSKACFKASDKYETYSELLNYVPQPQSFKLKIDSKGDWIKSIESLFKKWQDEYSHLQLKMIIKPLTGVDCENIVVINQYSDISHDLEKIYPKNSKIIVQKYIDGVDVSVSLISDGKKAKALSLNKQLIEINKSDGVYLGGTLPYESKFKEKIFDIATKAVESIGGLKGFVGVDLKISNDENDVNSIYLLEINSRFTTPYVGLKKIININIGKTIIDLVEGNTNIDDLKISLDGEVEFIKSEESLKIRRI